MIESSNFKLPNPDLEAEIYYLTQAEGGRSTWVGTGYRGQFYYVGNNWDAGQQFLDKTSCNLGDSVYVLIQTASPSQHIGRFFVGKTFEIREGARIVGLGRITKIINPLFKKEE